MRRLLVVLAVSVLASRAGGQQVYLPPQELPAVESEASQDDVIDPLESVRRSNPVLWQEYQALGSTAPATGAACGCGGDGLPYNRCGCNPQLFPWIKGPGMCDSWCVGPKWIIEGDGLFLFRDDCDWSQIVADVGTPPDLLENFDSAVGARLFVTGYNWNDFGLQIGYEGANDWEATAIFPQAGAVQTFDYESRLNSVEINFLSRTQWPVKFFAGIRYIEIDENFEEFTANDVPIPAPADPPAAPVAIVDDGTSRLLTNRLVGFQLGGFRDGWDLGRWLTLEGFANAGIYCNMFKRENVTSTVTTIVTGDDISTPEDEFSITSSEVRTITRQDFDEIAFAGEVGVNSVMRLTQCVALRCGYQALVVDTVGQGLDAFFVADMAESTVLYHGLQFGLEYHR